MASFKTVDNQIVNDGDKRTLLLVKGDPTPRKSTAGADLPTGDYSERQVTGIVRSYDHIDRVLDADGYAIDKIVTRVWEIETGDPAHPAVGFLVENVKSAKKA